MFRSKRRELQENIAKTNIDILISLIPMLLVAFLVYQVTPILVILSAVIGSELAEVIFSLLIQRKKDTLKDFSGIVIGALTGLVLAPFTPIYVAAFAGAMATLFGKTIYGETEKKIFNPVILGKLFVFDNGIGIDKSVENHLFEEFVTNKPDNEGRGMGLYIVTTLLNEFGATITLDDERNQYGNLYKFIITFPDAEV